MPEILGHYKCYIIIIIINLCRPYLRNPVGDFTAARTDDTTPDGHELQWFWLRLLLMLTGGATLHN